MASSSLEGAVTKVVGGRLERFCVVVVSPVRSPLLGLAFVFR